MVKPSFPSFCHLHCHTDFSLLDGAAKITQLVKQTKALGMQELAITDHGNLFGVPQFVSTTQQMGIKPIIGCEFYLAEDMHNHKDKTRFHQILLAKNEEGYRNLTRLSSLSFLEGYYYKPRIDKNLLKQYAKGLIATTCCLAGQVPRAILRQGEVAAEQVFLSWLEIFESDYYIELQRHGIPEQEQCNQVLLKWAHKYKVKIIATNDVHYVTQQDSVAQDVLLCLQTGKDYNDPHRMRFDNDQFFLKSPEAMAVTFQDLPEALFNTQEIVDKVEAISLARDILLPIFDLPTPFTSADAYLAHLAHQGAQYRYGTLSTILQERLNYELSVIQKTGFAGYFLIVQDFIQAAHQLKVMVGPGRGSVAGSMVAYCIGITNVDPIHYNLLFERFLNPERISMPDIDIDFDDEGRKRVIDYVVDKYGRRQVASIITFGSMAAKSAIKDVARTLGVPLATANHLAKLVPDKPGTTLAQAFEQVTELKKLKRSIDTPESKVLDLAVTLEGSVRHTGIHAAGIIITPKDLLELLPVKSDKNADLLVTQYDGSVLEDMGILKMDFLGLKTLTIIKDTLHLVQKNHGQEIGLNEIPFDDPKTFALYQAGATKGVFQFESEGMRVWLKKLIPANIEDLIAMNALYRPGPMQFIPNFIARKHGHEKVIYPHPLLEDLLKNTYGIMVYQEQIMETAQRLGGYSLGAADLLRRAMGKKKVKEMEEQEEVFIEGAYTKHQIQKKDAVAVFNMMKEFAQYGFNRSHSAAYTIISYQTAFLKANYPAEYMASVLTHHEGDIDKLAFFMEETRQLGINILGPDINLSGAHFSPSSNETIRFGLKAIKGTGDGAMDAVIASRGNGFQDIYDFVARIPLKAVNKKTIECLALSGGFDQLTPFHRKQYVDKNMRKESFIDKLTQYGQQLHKERQEAVPSLFASGLGEQIKKPEPAPCRPYDLLEQLAIEKDLVGFYISGHPLDKYKVVMQSFCPVASDTLLMQERAEIHIVGIVAVATIKQNKKGGFFALLTLEDYKGSFDIALFGEAYLNHQEQCEVGKLLFLSGSVTASYRGKNEKVFKPHTLILLDDVYTKVTKALHITLDIDALNKDIVSHLVDCIKKYPGSKPLKITLLDTKSKLLLPTMVQRYQVDISHSLIEEMNQWAMEVGLE